MIGRIKKKKIEHWHNMEEDSMAYNDSVELIRPKVSDELDSWYYTDYNSDLWISIRVVLIN